MPGQLSLVPEKPSDPESIVAFFRRDLRGIVSTHKLMFERLLFQKEQLSLQLADLFEDVGNTYLDISEIISELHRPRGRKQSRKRTKRR
jgi:hypothetical protein